MLGRQRAPGDQRARGNHSKHPHWLVSYFVNRSPVMNTCARNPSYR
jgi:hypothetical protein